MSDDEGQTSSESILFAEHTQAQHWIASLADLQSTSAVRNDALARLRNTLDRYLECPTLLDPYLEAMISSLTTAARSRMDHCGDNETDPFDVGGLPHTLSAVYSLCKVRGYKRVKRFLSHEVRDVEPIFRILRRIGAASITSTTDEEGGPVRWESVYVLWVWMEMLSLVPFDCGVLSDDSFLSQLISLGKEHIAHAGPTRDVASSCLASWLIRPDLQTDLALFVQWSCDILIDFGNSNGTQRDVVVVMGVMQTLAGLVKTTTNRNSFEGMERLWEPALIVAEGQAAQSAMLLRKLMVKWFARMGCAYLPPRVASWRYQRGRRSLLENMTSPQADPVVADTNGDSTLGVLRDEQDELFHVPDQVEDAMGLILQSLTDPSTVVRWSAAKGVGRLTERLPSVCADDVLDALLGLFRDAEKDHAWHGACLALAELARRGLLLPGRLDDVVPLVIRAIQFDVRRGQTSVGANVRDAACYTYWAFARAYSPSVLKPYVAALSPSIVIASLFDREINCRRAASAAFQECVGRQGADRFTHGISILTAADYYSLGNVQHAYTTVAQYVAQFQDYRRPIIVHLFTVKLFHWDCAVRKLTSKALHGLSSIDVNFIADEVVPCLVAKSTDDVLATRHGAVLGLAELVVSFGGENERPLSIARLGETILEAIADLVATIERKRLYRGRGGELMRSGVCRLIECMSLAKLPLAVRQQVRLLDTVDACLKHPSNEIQVASSRALHALMRSYFPVGPTGPSDRLQNRVVDKYVLMVITSINPAETRGFARALGVLPRKLISPSWSVLSAIIECLCNASRHDAKVGDEGDAETRRNALTALACICDEVGIRGDCMSYSSVSLSPKQTGHLFDTFLLGLEDYSIDRRGDVGSWCRMAAMSGIESLTYLCADGMPPEQPSIDSGSITSEGQNQLTDASPATSEASFLNEQLCGRIVGGLLKQLSEKLDNVRAHAGTCLERILTCESPSVPHVPKKTALCSALGLAQPRKVTNWSNGYATFKMVLTAADLDEYFDSIVSGLIISVGGLGESVAKPAEEALLAWVKSSPAKSDSCRADRLAEALLKVFRHHQRERRVTLPLLKTIDILLSRGRLNTVINNGESTFSASLLLCLKAEASKCTDVHRLLAIVSVSLGILSPHQSKPINENILVLVFRMLGHPYPRVRRYTADQLYVRLLEEPDVVPRQTSLDDAMAVLLEGQWDVDLGLAGIRKQRTHVAELLGVSLPVTATTPMNTSTTHIAESTKPTRTDDFASYASFVNDIT